jgi:uncharacterized protein YbjQ (UPF0145 family)
MARDNMLMTTSDEIADRQILHTIGLVYGNTIRARHVGRDILAALKGLVGGEIDDYTKMLAEAREQALDRMAAQARALGADAVVCVRFNTVEVMSTAAEMVAYGTAVTLNSED